MARGSTGKITDAIEGLISAHRYYVESTPGTEVVGDADADGTSICTLSITAEKRFICTHLQASTNVGALLRIGTGDLGSVTDIYQIDLQNVGSFVAISPDMPIFEYDNSASSTAVTLRIYAPKTAYGATTNNDASHYFYGFIGGIEY